MEDYVVKRFKSSAILVTLPAWLDRDMALREGEEWASNSGLIMSAYNDSTTVFVIPMTYTVRIKISRYPLPLWHYYFFSMVVASMRETGKSTINFK
jgi:hypothetical protein